MHMYQLRGHTCNFHGENSYAGLPAKLLFFATVKKKCFYGRPGYEARLVVKNSLSQRVPIFLRGQGEGVYALIPL
jgi:hypothetical protein